MFNIGKRGQEGLTLTTLLLIVVGVVVAVVIILGATGILGNIFDSGETVTPSKLQAAVEGCKIALQAGLVADYCFDVKEIGDKEFVTCDDPRIENSIEGVELSISCGGDRSLQVNQTLEEFCMTPEGKRSGVMVNGQNCAYWNSSVSS